MSKPIRAWCVKSRKDNLLIHFISKNPDDCIRSFVKYAGVPGVDYWEDYEARGCRCVPVLITEVEE